MSAGRSSLCFGALALLAGMIMVSPSPTDAAVVPSGRSLFVLHDSVVFNARPALAHRLDEWDISYLGFHGLEASAAIGLLDSHRPPIPATVVVSFNYMTPRSASPEPFRRVLRSLGAARRVLWILPGVTRPEIVDMREAMLEAVAGDDRVEVLDWHPTWASGDHITDVLGVHLSPVGAWHYATMIGRALDAPTGDPPSRGTLSVGSRAAFDVAHGWALDLETDRSRRVDVYVDGMFRRRVRADRRRHDVAEAFGLGPHHGFRARFELDDGRHQICALTSAGANRGMQPLGCEVLTVAHDPIGAVGTVSADRETTVVNGWAFDPDRTDPVDVHIVVDGQTVRTVTADRPRRDVAQVHPGRVHVGFRVRFDRVAPGATVCVAAVNQAAGDDRLIGCVPFVGAA